MKNNKSLKSLLCVLACTLFLSSCVQEVPTSSGAQTSPATSSSEGKSVQSDLTSESVGQTSSDYTVSTTIVSSQTSDGDDYIYHRPDDDSRWPLSFLEYGQNFRNRLAKLIRASGSRTIGYKANNDVLEQSDHALSGNGVIPFYHPDNQSTNSWNKEHVWPNSRGAGESGPGSDPQMLRPTKTSDNNSRGNKFFGDAGDTWDPASLGYPAARGECARIIFYCATRYYDQCGSGGSTSGNAPLSLSNNPDDATGKHTMGRLDKLIEWNNTYPVTAQEIRRNDYLDDAGFARNPFIDHPEYANWIWSKDGLRTSAPKSDYQGEETSLPGTTYRYNYHPITGIGDLSYSVGIAGRESSTSSYYGMTDEAKNVKLPYYIVGEELIYENNTFKKDGDDIATFRFNQVSGSNYTITINGKQLCHYIDGTHYSIGYDSTDKAGYGNQWTVTLSSDGKAVIKGTTNAVYLEYYNGSFCGYKNAPKESLVLFR